MGRRGQSGEAFGFRRFFWKTLVQFVALCAAFDVGSNLSAPLTLWKEKIKGDPWALPVLFLIFVVCLLSLELLQRHLRSELEKLRSQPIANRRRAKVKAGRRQKNQTRR